jgi:hypothetical protein
MRLVDLFDPLQVSLAATPQCYPHPSEEWGDNDKCDVEINHSLAQCDESESEIVFVMPNV